MVGLGQKLVYLSNIEAGEYSLPELCGLNSPVQGPLKDSLTGGGGGGGVQAKLRNSPHILLQ